jgi:cell division protein FtsW
MARKLKSDAVLFGTTVLLLVISMAWVYSASVSNADSNTWWKQGVFIVAGMGGLFYAMNHDYRRLCNRRTLLWIAGATTLTLVAVLAFGHEVNGGRRWIGTSLIRVQPSEIARFVAVLFTATVLGRRLDDQEPLEPGYFQAGVLVVLYAALIILERDYGGAIVLMAAGFAIMFVAGLPYRWVATAAAALIPPVMAILWFSKHSRGRLQTWWDPFASAQHGGFQTVQSLIAVGAGGVWGKGFGESVQKMFYLPEAHNDYIFAVISEERGLIGAAVVVACFALIVWRGLRAARRAPDAFGSLLAVGITAMFGIPAMVNMCVVTNLLPAKGLSLPFVSAGGSSMIVSLVAMGVLLNISQQASAPATE